MTLALWRSMVRGVDHDTVVADAFGEYQSYQRPAQKRELGIANFQRVDIGIADRAG